MPSSNLSYDDLMLVSILLTIGSGGAAFPLLLFVSIPAILNSLGDYMKQGIGGITGIFIIRKLGSIVFRIVNNNMKKNPFSGISMNTSTLLDKLPVNLETVGERLTPLIVDLSRRHQLIVAVLCILAIIYKMYEYNKTTSPPFLKPILDKYASTTTSINKVLMGDDTTNTNKITLDEDDTQTRVEFEILSVFYTIRSILNRNLDRKKINIETKKQICLEYGDFLIGYLSCLFRFKTQESLTRLQTDLQQNTRVVNEMYILLELLYKIEFNNVTEFSENTDFITTFHKFIQTYIFNELEDNNYEYMFLSLKMMRNSQLFTNVIINSTHLSQLQQKDLQIYKKRVITIKPNEIYIMDGPTAFRADIHTKMDLQNSKRLNFISRIAHTLSKRHDVSPTTGGRKTKKTYIKRKKKSRKFL